MFSANSVQVNQERCVGCKSCMIACPYGAMEIVTMEKLELVERGKSERMVRVKTVEAQKCDLCAPYDEGPACIRVCLTKAGRSESDVGCDEEPSGERGNRGRRDDDLSWRLVGSWRMRLVSRK
jgi:Fe-S-cluster-containing hydrogenase component 2